MILKVADCSQVNKEYKHLLSHDKGTSTETQINDISWWFFGNIDRAKVTYYHNNATAHLACPEPDKLFTNVNFNKKCECSGEVVNGMIEGCSECVVTTVISCGLENGNDFTVILDTAAYLLSDNGKIIEKIKLNYK